ncbi:3'-5' exonuclease [bacterium]|nr:3'-5' exonuclease [bacterium]
MRKRARTSEATLPLFTNGQLPAAEKTKPLARLQLVRPLIFFDLETTGLDPQTDRIVQFAFLRVLPDHKVESWMELVNPGIPIPPEASRVHHITDEMVAGKPSMRDLAPRISAYLAGCDLAGYNVLRFDLPFLQAELERHGQPFDTAQTHVIDCQVIFHKKEPRDLSAAVRLYCQRELSNAHDAAADIAATLEVLDGQLARYPDLPRDLAGLSAFCSNGDRARWVTGDRKFFWRNGEAVIAFGKNRGKSLQWLYENDPDYLRWMSEKDFNDETLALIAAALRGEFPQKADGAE